jgi:NAD-dependent SIR2 family protein deacetylase
MRYDPTTVVDIRLFRVNQFPYLEVRRPFILGTAEKQWKPTLSHYFIQVLHDKGLLNRLYTQNIDGLDHQMYLPGDRIVNVHGSLAEIRCEFCGADYPSDQFRDEVRSKIRNIYNSADPTAPAESTNICCLKCRRPGVKPATVLYGTDLPKRFFQSIRADFPSASELMIVAGTSLTVSPANQLVGMVRSDVPRLVVNREAVGEELGLQYGERDGLLQGDCDAGFLALAMQLGWVEDLRRYRGEMCQASAALLDTATDAVAEPST